MHERKFKMKKTLWFVAFGLIALLSLCLPFTAFSAEEKVVFVSDKGKDTASGADVANAKKTLSAAYSALGSSGGTVVVCGPLTLTQDTGLPQNKKTVTLTSSYGGTDYAASGAKMILGSRLELFGATEFRSITLSVPAGHMIFCNGNDVTFGEAIKIVLTTGGSYPYIFGGAYCPATGTTAATCSFYDYTIRVDSGTWTCVHGGNYRNSGDQPSGYIGGVNLVINGGTFNGGANGVSDLGVITLTGFCGLDGDASLTINGGTIGTSVFLLGRPGASSAGNVLSNRGNVTLKVTGGKINCRQISLVQNGYATTLDGDYNAELTGATFSAAYGTTDCSGGKGLCRVRTDLEKVAATVKNGEKTVFLAPDGNDNASGLTRESAVATAAGAAKLLTGDKGATLVLCGDMTLSGLKTSDFSGVLTVTSLYCGKEYGGTLAISGKSELSAELCLENLKINAVDAELSAGGNSIIVGENVIVSGALSLTCGTGGDGHILSVKSGNFETLSGGSSDSGTVGVMMTGGSARTVYGASGARTGGMASVLLLGGAVDRIIVAEAGAVGDCGAAVYGGTVGTIAAVENGRCSGDFGVTLIGSAVSVPVTADSVSGERICVLPDGGELPAGFSDGGKVLFLSDGGKGDGFSPLTPIERPFSAVMKLSQSAPAYCAVVPIGRYSALSSVTLSDFGGKYFFGGVYAGIDWRAFFGAELRLGATLAFGTDAVVDCLSVVSATNSAYLAANCHSLTIGKSVVTSRDTDRAVDYYPSVVGGAVLADGASVELSSTDLTVWSGTWRYAYAGNILTSGGVTPRTITGNTSLTVNGGVYTGGVSANGMNHLTGDATLTVNGGVFKCSVYGTAVASPSVGKTARIKGNVTVTLNRGEFRGDLLFAQRDEDVEFEGRYVLTVAGGDISRVNAIRGIDSLAKNTGAESELNLSTEISTTAPQSGTVTVENPIAGFADPSVYFHDGWYYYTYSRDYNGGPALWMTRSPNVADLSASEPVMIWSAKVSGNTMKSLWAPQIYFLDGKWYIYATCAMTSTSEAAQRRPYVWVGKGATPYDGFDFFGTFENYDEEVYSYLSPRILEYGGTRYLIFGGFYRAEDKVAGQRHYQRMMICKLESPTRFATKVSVISEPDKNWEIDGKVQIQEGPFPIVTPGGTLYVAYAAGQTNSNEYCTGLLRFTGSASDDLTDRTKWTKLPEPLQFLDYENRVYSPGAMVFVPEPDGTGLWGIFHVKLYPDIGYSHRVLFAQPLTFVDDVPTMEAPQPLGTVYTMKKNTMPLASRIGSFDRTGTVSPAPDPFPVTTAEPDPGTDVPGTEPTNPSGSSSILLPLTVGAVLLAVGAVVAAVLILGKKKKK